MVLIKLPDGELIDNNTATTIRELKEAIEESHGIPVSDQSFFDFDREHLFDKEYVLFSTLGIRPISVLILEVDSLYRSLGDTIEVEETLMDEEKKEEEKKKKKKKNKKIKKRKRNKYDMDPIEELREEEAGKLFDDITREELDALMLC